MLICICDIKISDSDKCGELFSGQVTFDDTTGRIVSVDRNNSVNKNADITLSAEGSYLFPGLIDVHTHGRAGYDFTSAASEEMKIMAASYLACGVTSLMPTLASCEYEDMKKACRAIQECRSNEAGASFVGIHLEGRYINPQKRGAHNERLLAPLNADELDDLLDGINMPIHLSASFELDKDGSFARKATSFGATLGLAHTNASYEEALNAEKNGVVSYTHLMNAMPPLHQREGGAVCAALTGDKYCELICDGVHVKPEMVQLIYRMAGTDRLVLITDSMEATGCPDGDYKIAGMSVTVKNGKALTAAGALAGSTLSLIDGVENLCRFCDISFETAMLCATRNPARMVGIYDDYGSIATGKYADFLVINPETHKIELIVAKGRLYGKEND